MLVAGYWLLASGYWPKQGSFNLRQLPDQLEADREDGLLVSG